MGGERRQVDVMSSGSSPQWVQPTAQPTFLSNTRNLETTNTDNYLPLLASLLNNSCQFKSLLEATQLPS